MKLNCIWIFKLWNAMKEKYLSESSRFLEIHLYSRDILKCGTGKFSRAALITNTCRLKGLLTIGQMLVLARVKVKLDMVTGRKSRIFGYISSGDKVLKYTNNTHTVNNQWFRDQWQILELPSFHKAKSGTYIHTYIYTYIHKEIHLYICLYMT